MLVKCLWVGGGNHWKGQVQKRNRLFSIAFLIIPDAFLMESNFLTHLLHKYALLDSNGTVERVGVSGESELQDHYHQECI